jgi:hypothetical protein
MNCIQALPLLRSGVLLPCLVAGLWLAHSPLQAQGTSSAPPVDGPATAVATTSEATASAPASPTASPIAAPVPPADSPAAASATAADKPQSPGTRAKAPRNTRPTWAELTRSQQEALRPLAQDWPGLSELHKRKWLVLSQNYDEFSPQEQHKLQQRMSDWASLTARERAQARLHFAEVQQLPEDKRREKWEAYQALSDEQRRKLADDILLQPPRGAAVASRPVASSKLTQPPAAKPDQVLQPRIDTDQVQPKTLLPHFLQGTSTR